MKYYLLLISIISIIGITKGQVAVNYAEEMPYFATCKEESDLLKRKECSDKAITDFIYDNIVYPPLARKNNIQGMAVIRFVVDETGELQFDENAIVKNPGGLCGEEALRVIKSMPNWVPGKQGGKIVPVWVTLPVRFKLAVTKVDSIKKVVVRWDDLEMNGTYEIGDISKYIKAETSLEKLKEILSKKAKGMPLKAKENEKSILGFIKYFVANGKEGKKQLIESSLKNKSTKKKLLKGLSKGDILYFYNWQYKRKIMEIKIKN